MPFFNAALILHNLLRFLRSLLAKLRFLSLIAKFTFDLHWSHNVEKINLVVTNMVWSHLEDPLLSSMISKLNDNHIYFYKTWAFSLLWARCILRIAGVYRYSYGLMLAAEFWIYCGCDNFAGGIASEWVFLESSLLTLGMTAAAMIFVHDRNTRNARRMFHASLLYLPVFMSGLLLHRVPNENQESISITDNYIEPAIFEDIWGWKSNSRDKSMEDSFDRQVRPPVAYASIAPFPFLPAPLYIPQESWFLSNVHHVPYISAVILVTTMSNLFWKFKLFLFHSKLFEKLSLLNH